jgi:hypothetical protein
MRRFYSIDTNGDNASLMDPQESTFLLEAVTCPTTQHRFRSKTWTRLPVEMGVRLTR